jgi:LCP family protein required for cell wall assembly
VNTRRTIDAPRRSRGRAGSGKGPAAILGLIVAGVAVVFAGVFVAHRLADPHQSIATTLAQMLNPIPAPQTVFHKDRLTILLLGIDYNYDAKDQEYSSSSRSDTIMAMSLDLPTHSLHVLSVPRDMEYTYADGHIDKINTAYSVGGAHAAEHAVANFLGLPGFDRYVVLRINATKALVDAIGGIDVPVTETLNYDDTWGHLHIHFKPGLTHMNGDQAVSYSRFRHDACSDPCRIKRQQQVLRITIAKLKTDKFNDLTHITQLMSVVNQNVQTDLSPAEQLSLASAYSSFNLAALKSDQVPYVDDKVLPDSGDVLIPDVDAKQRLVQQLFLAQVIDPSATPNAAAIAAVQPSQIHVTVENGSGISGLGRTIANRLQESGYVIDSVGNAASFDHDATEVHVGAAGGNVGQAIKQTLAMNTVVIDTDADSAASTNASASVVRVVVGRDASVAAPTPAATATP